LLRLFPGTIFSGTIIAFLLSKCFRNVLEVRIGDTGNLFFNRGLTASRVEVRRHLKQFGER
jgi:hypothetical protein